MGLANGAELDVLSYLASRYFGLRNLGTIMGVLLSILTVFAGLGPLLPGAAFDAAGGYRGFLVALIPVIVISALTVWNLPPPDETRDRRA